MATFKFTHTAYALTPLAPVNLVLPYGVGAVSDFVGGVHEGCIMSG